MNGPDVEGRRYEVLRLLGEGGFGRVYQARMSSAGGFSKEVAIKLLNRDGAPEHVLERFRDESRILGLVRDRAIISVDPPTRLEGRWAVVMEYVEGVSAAALVEQGALPPRVAVEVIQEVARALDHVYTAPGPDGAPLHLIHRDLKPDNLQITPSGDVKILDFGIAKATFAKREARTTSNISGTFGYIAPERMEGEDLPAGDIYSLGIVLKVLVTGALPSRRANHDPVAHPGPVGQVLALAGRMCDSEPEARPTAAEVERLCMALVAELGGEPLRFWARQGVPRAMAHRDDALVGTVLTETLSSVPVALEDKAGLTRSRGRLAMFAAALGTFGLAGAAALLLGVAVLAAGVGYVVARPGAEVVAAEPVAAAAPEASPAPGSNAAEEEAAAPAPEPAVAPVPAEDHRPTTAPDVVSPPTVAPAAAPAPAPAVPAATAPSKATFPITFNSVPMGADVYVDDLHIGQTPLVGFQVVAGDHRVRMVLGAESGTRDVSVGKRGATKYIWTGGDTWQVRY